LCFAGAGSRRGRFWTPPCLGTILPGRRVIHSIDADVILYYFLIQGPALEAAMPTYFGTPEFYRMYRRLTPAQRLRFMEAVGKLAEGLVAGKFRKSLRIKRVQGSEEAWEMTWAPGGRAMFRYGAEVKPGHPHVVWLRVGGHEIFEN
jgi:hypothetical protein